MVLWQAIVPFSFTQRPVPESRIGKGISAQALHKTVLEILTSHGFSHSA